MKYIAARKRILCAVIAVFATVLSLCACANKITLDKQLDGIDKLVVADADGAILGRDAINDVLGAFRGLTVTEIDDHTAGARSPLITGYANDIKNVEISIDDFGRAYVTLFEPDGEFAEYRSMQNAVDRVKLDETIDKYTTR